MVYEGLNPLPRRTLWLLAGAFAVVSLLLDSILPPPMNLSGAFVIAFFAGPMLSLSRRPVDAAMYTAASAALLLLPQHPIYESMSFFFLGLTLGVVTAWISYVVRREALKVGVGKSDQRYKILLRSFNQWIWTQDSDFRFTSMNGFENSKESQDGNAANVGGANVDIGHHEYEIGKRIWDIPGAIPESGTWDDHRAMLERHEPFFDFYYSVRDNENTLRWLNVSGIPLFDDSRKFSGYTGITRDITESHATRNELSARNQELSALLSSSPIGTVVLDASGNVVEFNDAVSRFLGYSRDEVIGKPSAVFSDASNNFAKNIEEPAAKRSSQFWQHVRLLHKSGAFINAAISTSPIYDSKGDYAGCISCIEDLSEHERIKSELDRSAAFLSAVTDQSPIGIVVYNKDFRLKHFNRSAAIILGASSGGAVELDATFEGSIDNGEYRNIIEDVKRGTEVNNREIKLIRGDASKRWLLVSSFSISDSFGARLGCVLMYQDMTEVHTAREMLLGIAENSPSAIAMIRRSDTTFQFINSKYAANYGKSADEMLGRRLADFGSDESLAMLTKILPDVFAGKIARIELLMPAGGESRWMDVSVSPCCNAFGEVDAVLLTLFDIHDAKEANFRVRKQEDRLSKMFSSAPFPIYARDRNGRVTFMNMEARRLFQRTEEEIVGQAEWFGVGDKSDKSIFSRAIFGDFGSKQNLEIALGKDSHTFEVWAEKLTGDSGAANEFVFFLMDITTEIRNRWLSARNERLLNTSIDASPVAIVFRDEYGHFAYSNESGMKLLRMMETNVAASAAATSRTTEDAESRKVWADNLAAVATGEKSSVKMDIAIVDENGQRLYFTGSVSAVLAENTEPIGIVIAMLDVTEKRMIGERAEILASVMENASDAVVTLDASFAISSVNPAFSLIAGYEKAEIMHESFVKLLRGKEEVEAFAAGQDELNDAGFWSKRIFMRRKNGEVFRCNISVSAARASSSGLISYVAVFDDLSSTSSVENGDKEAVMRDVVTALPSATLFTDRLEQVLSSSNRRTQMSACLIVNIGHFSSVNDSLGMTAGDAILKEIGRRITKCLHEGDTASRLGGSKYGVILDELPGWERAAEVGNAISRSITDKLLVGGNELFLEVNIGIACYPLDGLNAAELMTAAETACWSAEENAAAGTPAIEFKAPEINERIFEFFSVSHSLRDAPDNGELYLNYQPIVLSDSMKIIGVEALVRWRHSAMGSLLPSRFMPTAIRTGMVGKIDMWAARRAFAEAKKWQDKNLGTLFMYINIAEQTFSSTEFPSQINAVARDCGINPAIISIEVSSSAVNDDIDHATAIVRALRDSGFSFGINDFGVGEISLSFLASAGVNYLKIDRLVVRSINSSSQSAAICQSAISIGEAMGIAVSAVGVENADQCTALLKMHCAQIQGNYISRPCSESEIVSMIGDSTKLADRLSF